MVYLKIIKGQKNKVFFRVEQSILLDFFFFFLTKMFYYSFPISMVMSWTRLTIDQLFMYNLQMHRKDTFGCFSLSISKTTNTTVMDGDDVI